ncbi:MAG TPA: response regulator, partial [Vicinamibacteria bacterium]|nr:response regulator [Vicinamibacteria bacterium]
HTPMPVRILVVEDDHDTGDLLKLALGGRGYETSLAGGADEALAALRAERYDLLLTDYDMPRKTGAQLLREARQAGLLEHTAALVVTAHPEPRGLDPGTPLLRKPLDIERLLVQVAAILHGPRAAEDTPVRPAGANGQSPHLVLYVNRTSTLSAQAQQRMQEILARYDTSRLRFEVCDLIEHVDSAARDRVLFTPTLVYRGPGTPAWVLGDLSDAHVVEDLLALAGAVPLASGPGG